MSIDDAARFLSDLKPGDEVVIVFNNDADGICSCILVKSIIQSRTKKKPYIISQPMPTEKNLIRKIQTTLPTKIIFLDLAMDQQEGVIKKLKGICDIMVIDHHMVMKDLNAKGIVHYNPRFAGREIYQSTSYCAYRICSRIEDVSDRLWIAAVGIIGDYNLKDSQDVVAEVRKKYRSLVGDRELYETPLGRIADMIAASKATRALTCERVAEILENMHNPDEVFGNEKMVEAYKSVELEMAALVADAERNAEVHKDLMLYEIKSAYNLASPFSTRFSDKFQEKFVAVYERINKIVKISARNQSGTYDVAHTLKRAARGLSASAGGHDRAAGATVSEKEWEQFKVRLIEILSR
ncbi:MAG: DHH family phosphoesterase [Candidatus Aenigmarchaeota archaeon]|nr:DHH family phosphoesterase [Candidatus Aenigmarchaeota archaeon]